MIPTPCYPYPDTSSARRAALHPRIYSPPESHGSPRHTMYPHLHAPGSPAPSYIYSAYEHYYPKDSRLAAAAAAPGSWSAFYHLLPRSSSPSTTTVNPKVTIQPVLVSDIDTPSSLSSHSVLTPSSPFTQQDIDGVGFQDMEFDEFDCDDDDDDDFVDSDFADEMEGIDEADQGPSPLYGASVPHVIKSTSALEGALGDAPSSSYGTNLGIFIPADRRLSASVPGYPSNSSHRTTSASHQQCAEPPHPPALATTSPSPAASYPSQHTYTQRNDSSSASLSSLYNHASSSSSLAGAFASSVLSSHVSRSTSNPLPILQPQPIRPIPPIPLADLTSRANVESEPPESPRLRASRPLRMLSPLPLLCQPVSDAVRYQLKAPPIGGDLDDACYDKENIPDPMCEDFVTTSEDGRFARGTVFCPGHESANGSCLMEEELYSCGCMDLPVRWQ